MTQWPATSAAGTYLRIREAINAAAKSLSSDARKG
jgi:hypothetical protein